MPADADVCIATAAATAAGTYSEVRRHSVTRTQQLMLGNQLVNNARTVDAGISARVYRDGYWGFAAAPSGTPAALRERAHAHAAALRRFGTRAPLALPQGAYRGIHLTAGATPLTPSECVERLQAVQAWLARRWPDLKSTRLLLQDEQHVKELETSNGAAVTSTIGRGLLMVSLIADDERGEPIEVHEFLTARGSVADLDLSEAALEPLLATAHRHLQAKRHAQPARGGLHTVVMGPELAGILAHEAMGHPCEADLVLGGAVTADLVGQRVASDLITMVDIAHTFRGAPVLMPVHADDEGTPAHDAVLIDRGRLSGYMHSRETAARMGQAATGNARAYLPNDEPLVRMRNTAILPGESKLADMIAGVERGYLLLRTRNGQADSTTEFMFGISLGYAIEDGRLGHAIRDTTLSGSAIKVLQSVDAVSDDMHWTAAGYCGKKQPMVVSMGGPAIRAQAQLGGV